MREGEEGGGESGLSDPILLHILILILYIQRYINTYFYKDMCIKLSTY